MFLSAYDDGVLVCVLTFSINPSTEAKKKYPPHTHKKQTLTLHCLNVFPHDVYIQRIERIPILSFIRMVRMWFDTSDRL